MGRKKLEEAGPPGSAGRLRVELVAADRFISFVTWGVAAGMIVWSMLNATPYVADHLAPEWRNTAFVLPLVVDLAFLGSLRADEIASRHNVSGGWWAAVLRLFTGAGSVFLNIGHAAEKGDWTGVFQHLITPGILVLLAEAGPVYRRRLAGRLDDVERAEADKAEAARKVAAAEADRRRRLAQEEADRQAEADRAEADRARRQRREDQEFALDLEEKRESARATRELQARRLDLEEKRLAVPVPAAHNGADGMTARRYNGTTAPIAPAPQPRSVAAPAAPVRVPVVPVASTPPTGVPAPQARTGAANGHPVAPKADPDTTAADKAAQALHSAPQAPAAPRTTDSAAFARPAEPAPAETRKDATASVAAAQTGPARVTARLDHQEDKPAPATPAGPVKDWDLPGLPAEVRPGVDPVMLTDAQVTARIDYGLTQEWTQRRIGEFAGRSATVVNRRKKERERAV
ncbi:hypothetical protein [Streptomyces marianii]|uniref:DUF2637 domain-containing protein n=1 Tax=Streptomyces marianii TaxID=1817406 RepID=A0A5R9DST8_9ACTN|nr:hypothetical protein [Streptomyces marianii]TLQ38599.1 hypothetical protein FEF34_40885 [Streptomyces marianii]